MKYNTLFQRIFFFAFFALVMIGMILVISPFWQLLIVAAIAANLLFPAHRWLMGKTRAKPSVAAAIVYIFLLLLVMIPFVVVILIIGSQANQLILLLNQTDGRAFESLTNPLNEQGFVRQIENWLGLSLDDLINWLGQLIRDNLVSILSAITQAVGSIIGSTISLFLSFVMFSFFFVVLLLNHDRLRALIIKLNPLEPSATRMYLRRVGLMTRDVMLGVFGVAVIQTLIMWFVLAILNIPFAGVLAIFLFIFALIPFLGMSIITIPLGIVLLLMGAWLPALVIWGVHFLIINNIDLLLRPYLTSKELNVHLAMLVVGFVGGLVVFGVIGLFLGPIIIILFTTSLELYLENYGQTAISTSAGEQAIDSDKREKTQVN